MPERQVERRLLAVITAWWLAAYGFLSAASPAMPHRLLDPILARAWPHWPGALVLLACGWGLHVVLCLRQSRADPMLLPLVTLLVGIGWLEVLRLQPQLALRQAAWVAAGTVCFILWLRLVRDYRPLQDYRYGLLALAVGLQLLVMIFGVEINGARLWIRVGPLSFQPVEVIKVLLVLYLASYLRDYRELLSVGFLRGRLVAVRYLVPLVALVAACEAIFAKQKDLGVGLLFFGVFILMFFVATRRFDFVLLGLLSFGLLSALCYHLFWHVRVRFMAWSDPWPGADSWGFQIVQALYALASGGITGTGLGAGQPWQIPEVHTDFIFVALTEELGLVGAGAIIVVYLLLAQ
ncbi:MAG TPA: FtsW/RodA/SpoVE family cell cycle protein, partial [Candidatus Xenobia bacterium]